MPSRTRRAALVASRGWSIGISYDDHVATEARPRDGRRSDPDRLPSRGLASVATWSSYEIPMLHPRDATRAALRVRDGILLPLTRIGHSAATRLQVSLGGSS